MKSLPEEISAAPAKSFFVSMLTRDISLSDAILDLIDNAIDGATRSIKKAEFSKEKRLEGFHCNVEISKNKFRISDNCGGIPSEQLDYAFRMGRPPGAEKTGRPTVGVYGIGLKRALFKMGLSSTVESASEGALPFAVDFTKKWLGDEKTWQLPVRESDREEIGTTITITDIHPGVQQTFSTVVFTDDLIERIGGHYSFLISRGFKITVNNQVVSPRLPRFSFSDKVKPFAFETRVDGVSVRVVVGLTRAPPTENEIDYALEGAAKYSTIDAGWTILCNDRAVVFNDKTELTGWGEADVPAYHTQFIAIRGLVEFTASDASKLPTTTTKRGLDSASSLYLQVKNKMREGLKIFTAYTYRWKGKEKTAKQHLDSATELNMDEIFSKVAGSLRKLPDNKGRQFKPSLPSPKPEATDDVRLSFVRRTEEVESIRQNLNLAETVSASRVGEHCFDIQLKLAEKN